RRSARRWACSTRRSWASRACSWRGSGSPGGPGSPVPVKAHRRAASAALDGASAAARAVLHPGATKLRAERGGAARVLAAAAGGRGAGARGLSTAGGEHGGRLGKARALQPAEAVAVPVARMKGVLMKRGQMASYVPDGLPPAARRTLASLQDSVPPMSPELAA